MTETTSKTSTTRRPDCVTEVRMGNTILTVSGYFKQDTSATATDKMMKVLEAESTALHSQERISHPLCICDNPQLKILSIIYS